MYIYTHAKCVPSHFSCVRLFVTLWTIAWQAPLSMGLSCQEYWSVCFYINKLHLLYPFIYYWALRLLPYLGCCK